MKRTVKFAVGDLVQLSKFWGNKIGIVKADDTAWYVLRRHFDIADCICSPSDVVRVIRKRAISPKLLKYI
jgi:hypothetical protein